MVLPKMKKDLNYMATQVASCWFPIMHAEGPSSRIITMLKNGKYMCVYILQKQLNKTFCLKVDDSQNEKASS